MIELLLQAERALALGMVDRAEQLYRQAADADPRNSIAVVGLARVALERADDAGALQEARRALAIDRENAAAGRLVARLEEVLAYRGEALPAADADPPAADGREPEAADAAEPAPADAAEPEATDAPEPAAAGAVEPAAADPAVEPEPSQPDRGLVDRLFRRSRP